MHLRHRAGSVVDAATSAAEQGRCKPAHGRCVRLTSAMPAAALEAKCSPNRRTCAAPMPPSLSRHDARSNINYHHQISIPCYIPSNFNWNLQGVIHRPRGPQAQADEPVQQDTCCRHKLFSMSSSVLARVRARVLAHARARALVRERVRGALMWPCACALAFGCWGVCGCVRAVACSRLYETVEMCVRATCVLVHPGTRPHGGWLHGIQPGYKNAHAAPDGCLCARCLYTTPCCLYSRTPAVAV